MRVWEWVNIESLYFREIDRNPNPAQISRNFRPPEGSPNFGGGDRETLAQAKDAPPATPQQLRDGSTAAYDLQS